MKTNHIILLLIALLFTFSACREITVTTKVNKDGSFTRIIKITGDSTDIFKKDLPYPIDEKWLMEVKHDSVDTSMYVTYTKTYSDSDLLNTEMQNDTSWMSRLDRRIEIRNKFGFFYSYLTFDEYIRAANPFIFLNFNDYLNAEDMKWLSNEILPKTSDDTITLEEVEEKALEFLACSITAEIVDILETGIRQLDDPDIDPQIVQMNHDSLLKLVNEWAFDKPDIFIDSLSGWIENTELLKLKQQEPDLFNEFNIKVKYFNRVFDMHDYHQYVEMPGLITETNSQVLKGNSVSWEVENGSFLFVDYTMHVESRVVNYWMFALTGLLVLVLIVFLLIKAFK